MSNKKEEEAQSFLNQQFILWDGCQGTHFHGVEWNYGSVNSWVKDNVLKGKKKIVVLCNMMESLD